MLVVLLFVSYFIRKRHRRRSLGSKTVFRRALSKPSGSIINEKPTNDTDYNARLNRFTPYELNIWVGFLSTYGEQGVPLRELIMLVSALYFPLAELGGIHSDSSLVDGLKLENAPDFNTLFLSLLKEVSCKEQLTELEQKLVSLGVLLVHGADEQRSVGSDQDWVVDSRSWCPGRRQHEAKIDVVEVCKNLLIMYSRIPDRAAHSLAERHRELSYYHAHPAIMYIYRIIRDGRLVLDDWEERFCDVTLNVVSHRYQPGDAEIVEYVGYLLTKAVSNTDSTASSIKHRALDQRKMVRLLLYDLIKLREGASQDQYQRARPKAKSLSHRSMNLLYSILEKPNTCHATTWGSAGYVLAELIATAEVAHDVEGMEQFVKCAKEWCAKSMTSDFKKLEAVCCVFVKLQAFDELHKVPTENNLACGYYLARAGFFRLAERFLESGLQYNEQKRPSLPMWRYHLELWTVRMRLGHWKDAEHWLLDTWHGLSTRSNDLPAGEFDFWKLSGEFGEFKLNLASLLSDCYVSEGLYVEASNILKTTIGSINRMRDTYISATRVTLLSRLLNVQLHIEEPHHAAMTALQLCRELHDHRLRHLQSLDASWTVQEVLGCVNELIKKGLPKKAYVLLKEVDNARLCFQQEFVSARLEIPYNYLDFYIDQRFRAAESLIGVEDPLISQQPLSEWLIDLTMQPQLFGITKSNYQSQVLAVLAERTPKLGSDLSDSYIFPAPRSKANVAQLLRNYQRPLAEDPEHLSTEQVSENASTGPQVQGSGETAATLDQQEAASEARQSQTIDHRQVVKERKAANRKRRRDNFRMLMKLRKPPNNIPSQPSAVEEGRLGGENVGEGLSSHREGLYEMTGSIVVEL